MQIESVFAFLDIANPLVAWHVYRGAVVSSATVHESALSLWMTRYLEAVHAGKPRQERLCKEFELEQIRRREHAQAVSRLHGFFAFPDEETALRAGAAWTGRHFKADFLAELGLDRNSKASFYDAEWISNGLDSADPSWAHDYFEGKAFGEDPTWEILIDGKAIVFGTALREAAYETVKRVWPDSLPLLELARVGVELNSDIGLITPMLRDDKDGTEVVYCINMQDAKNETFLNRLAEFDGPKNTADLNYESDLIPPDLRRGFFRL